METFFIIALTISIICIPLATIKPRIFVKDGEKPNKLKALVISLVMTTVSYYGLEITQKFNQSFTEPDAINQSTTQTLEYPRTQKDFCYIITSYKKIYTKEQGKPNYIDKETNLKKIFDDRTTKLRNVLLSGNIEQWKGTIDTISTVKNKGAHLTVKIPCYTTLETNDKLIIPIETDLYNSLRQLHETSKVRFSGEFITPEDHKTNTYPHKTYYSEKSFSQVGSMTAPEFYFKYTEIRPL